MEATQSRKTVVEEKAPRTLAEASTRPRGRVQPSPDSWLDATLYFLMVDRFSDGKETQDQNGEKRERFTPQRAKDFAISSDSVSWREDGKRFLGGNIAGVTSKLGYLKGLGITTIWITPIMKQRADLETFHGYGIQNFLEVDPRFGTRQDLRDLCDKAHSMGMYVVLDIIINHTGNNFFYSFPATWRETMTSWLNPYNYFGGTSTPTAKYQTTASFKRHGEYSTAWRGGDGKPVAQILGLEEGVWPKEFQNMDWYSKKGAIDNWDHSHEDRKEGQDEFHAKVEFRVGDFMDLKDINTDNKECLDALIKVYQYWIALSDCDGFRIDTLKHVSVESAKRFCFEIKEFAKKIGKKNFWIMGEVIGDSQIRKYLENPSITSCLDVGGITQTLVDVAKGRAAPQTYFHNSQLSDLRNSGERLITVMDDHDMIGKRKCARFAADLPPGQAQTYLQVFNGVALTTLSSGAGCIYYGTEQAFNGTEDWNGWNGYKDSYVRETMFGGRFGAFKTQGCHFFNPDHPTYKRISAMNAIRNSNLAVGMALKRGKQFLREVSYDGKTFPWYDQLKAGDVIAWSRIYKDTEVTIAINPTEHEKKVFITIDAQMGRPKSNRLSIIFRSVAPDAELQGNGVARVDHERVTIQRQTSGRTHTSVITLKPFELVIFH